MGDCERTARVVAQVCGLERPPAGEADLVADLGCTSFDMMAICVQLEQEFGCGIDYARLRDVRTVADLSDVVGA
ncbi:MAG: acyl carrier protein [Coriobacteriia bacterium]|nr:acyl carrier protein [Coriobacteriia bacterium]MBS5477897.1 acyl carrier protein [Coriobacteriia bacterium]